MKKRIEIKVINRYGKTIKTVIYNGTGAAAAAAERLKNIYFDDTQILIIDKTKYKNTEV